MRLTLINLFKKSVPGHIFRGKRRLVKPVSRKSMNTLINEYEQQESNMLLLRHPYLTLVSLKFCDNLIALYINYLIFRKSHLDMPRN